jgi:hypothetical protein
MSWIIMCLRVVWIALFLLGAESALAADNPAGRNAAAAVVMRGAHATLACSDCHLDQGGADPLDRCETCHPGTGGILHGPMAMRAAEQDFVARSYGRVDPDFFATNCGSCHVRSCLECHGGDGHAIRVPRTEDCHSCHRGYFVGADYQGWAPREDASRYQRGPSFGGEHYLKMCSDVHAEAGLPCGSCHAMQSLADGRRTAKNCRDCHTPDPTVIEHGIAAHLERLECYACHSAWAAQEYGTFFIRVRNGIIPDYFDSILRRQAGKGYIRSAYLRQQDSPPLGLNSAGKVSPIRPQFIAYFSDLKEEEQVLEENRLLTAQWKAFFPHTVQRGTVLCEGCHDNPGRFLLEPPEDHIYQLARDEMTLGSFWDQTGQEVMNGRFYDLERYERMNRKGPDYQRAFVSKWKKMIDPGEGSLKP